MASARKHLIADDDMLHACRNPIRVFERDERPVEEYLLERAALARARSERQIVDAIATARAKGVSWQRIGELLGTSAQAAQQRYGSVITAG